MAKWEAPLSWMGTVNMKKNISLWFLWSSLGWNGRVEQKSYKTFWFDKEMYKSHMLLIKTKAQKAVFLGS